MNPAELEVRSLEPMIHIMWWRKIVLYGVAVATLLVSGVQARDKKTKDRLYLDGRDILQIDYSVAVDPRLMGSPSLADSTRDWKERLFKQSIDPVLEWSDFPMEHILLEPGKRPEKGEPVLKFHAMRWGQDFTGEIEALLQVDLHAYGYRYKIGTYHNTERPPISPSRDLLEEAYIKAMQLSLREAIYDLLPSFEEPPEPTEDP